MRWFSPLANLAVLAIRVRAENARFAAASETTAADLTSLTRYPEHDHAAHLARFRDDVLGMFMAILDVQVVATSLPVDPGRAGHSARSR